jgi:hypothetical protein
MSAIDDQHFYNHMTSLSWDLDDYTEWMASYESQRDGYPDWVTKDRQHIKVRDITNSHLENLIHFVYRKDPDNETHWIDVLKAEKRYRELKKKVPQMKAELAHMREVSDLCL